MTIENPAAFPAGWPEARYEPHYGMTLRDWFAGQAVISLGSLCERGLPFDVSKSPKLFARGAYAIADAMLAERKRNDR